jgi:predicted dehydrogenase
MGTESNRKQKHFLVVGFGSIGRRHVRNLKKLFANCRITVLRHGNGCRELKKMAGNGVDGCVENLDTAVENNLTAAIIANPASLHLETARQLAEKKIPLFIEKPFSHSTAGLSEFVDLCDETGTELMIGYNLRFSPSLQKFRQLLSEGAVGQILSVRSEVGQFLPSWRPTQDYRLTVSAQKKLGGGVLLELSHEIDYLVWLFGNVESVTGIACRQSDLEIDVEDMAQLLLMFSKRIDGKNIIASVSMDFFRHDTTRNCTVIGTGGTLRWDGIKRSVELFEKTNRKWQLLYLDETDANSSYMRELRFFVEQIESDKIPSIGASVYEAIHVVEIIEAIKTSSNRHGRTAWLNHLYPLGKKEN